MTALSPANCSTKNLLRTLRFYLRKRRLPEDVFYFIEDGGVAVRGPVFRLHRGAQLLDQFPLVARKLCRRHHPHVIVQISLAAAARISQSLSLDPKNSAALCAFGNLELFLPVQPRNLQFRAKSRLGDAYRDGAIQARAAPF